MSKTDEGRIGMREKQEGVIPTGAAFQAEGGILRGVCQSIYPPGNTLPVPTDALLVVHPNSYTSPISLGSALAALP